MTKDEFDRRVIGKETPFIVEFDVRPFGAEQQEAVAVFLGEQMFRQSIGTLNTSQRAIIVVDTDYESTAQLEGFVEKLKSAGLRVTFEKR